MEKRRHLNEVFGATGEMSVTFDVATGEVCSTCSGFWSLEQATAFFDDWRTMVNRIHGGGRSVWALVDMARSGVQKADVAALIASHTRNLYREGDVVAMLVPNSLAKMQMRRVLDPRYHGFFVSAHAAEMWRSGKALSRDPHRQGPVRVAS